MERLHSVLRPFLLRRLKSEVEKQMPPKHEHVIRCRLSKRQRTLYEDYMASSETRSTLSSGGFLGIINVLMSLRKVWMDFCSMHYILDWTGLRAKGLLGIHQAALVSLMLIWNAWDEAER